MSVITTENSLGLHGSDVMEIANPFEISDQLEELGLERQVQEAGERAKIYVAHGVEDSRIQAAAMYFGYAACGLDTQLHLRVRDHTSQELGMPVEPPEAKFGAMEDVYNAMRRWLRNNYVTSVYLLTSGVNDPNHSSIFGLADPLRPVISELDNDLRHNFYTHPVDGAKTIDQRLAESMAAQSLHRAA